MPGTKSIRSFLFLFLILFAFRSQIHAQVLQGSTTVSGANGMTINVTVNPRFDNVDISISGPSNVWYGYGFGGSNMTNRYSFIVTGSGMISERRLGNHNAGSLLTPSLTSSSGSVVGSTRTVQLSRPVQGPNSNYFTFPSNPGSITLIWARGQGVNLANHGSSNRGSAVITLSDICNIPVTNLGDTTVCPDQPVSIFGQIRTQPGVYFDTIVTSTGCDSLFSFELINQSVDTAVTVFNGDSLVASAVSATYQWLDCSTGLPIPGANDQFYVPDSAGTFAVEVIDGSGCVDTSSCYFAAPINSLELLDLGDQLSVNPNPFEDRIKLRANSRMNNVSIRLIDSKGSVKSSWSFESLRSKTLVVPELESGPYILIVETENAVGKYKVIR